MILYQRPPHAIVATPIGEIQSDPSHWPEPIDVGTGRIATGATVEPVRWESFRIIVEPAGGRKKAWADHWGLQKTRGRGSIPAPIA
jgi:hypothetical protein